MPFAAVARSTIFADSASTPKTLATGLPARSERATVKYRSTSRAVWFGYFDAAEGSAQCIASSARFNAGMIDARSIRAMSMSFDL